MGCRKSKNVEPTTGEVSQTTTANDQVKALAGKLKAEVEKEYGKELETFEAVSFRQQAVAGKLYFIKVNVGDEYIHLRVYDPIPKESEKAAASASSDQKTESAEEKKEESSEEKGESSEENGEGSEEKKEETDGNADSSEEAKGAETQTTEEKSTAKLEGLQKGKKLEDDIAEFETTEEPSEEKEEVPEEPKEEPKEEEPKEEAPKEEEPKEEPKEEGGSSLISMVKSGASDVAGGLGF
ncbi:cilia- and flagella-associated protein 251-like [Ostrea edulis]|uniref:cilia- and flagella-associated protein 251-like n=1 Tax=Ostrea edulis TaxID=37623 RepID=UPI00209451BE|nr:cilia- and flagella-associated protein 251-like [Ostrea edulis]XP_056013778.1 cilia- and flagella-associated protein 251-like [Ostrea edulis]